MKRKTILAAFMVLLLSGCSALPEKTTVPSSAVATTTATAQTSAYDGTKMTEHQITANSGGTISVADKNGRFDIAFSQGAVKTDKVFQVAAIEKVAGKAEDYLSTGFYLSERAGGAHVELEKPASICYTTAGEIPKGAMLVKYNDDFSGYTPVPTHRATIHGQNCLIALVQGFSGYGVKTLTQEEINRMGDELTQAGLDWTLKVDDSYKYTQTIAEDGTSAELKFTADLKLSMLNKESPGSWTMQGPYNGTADLSVGVGITADGETFTSSFSGKAEKESLQLCPVPKVHKATGDGPDLVSLVPDYYIGTGKLHFKWEHVNAGQAGTDIMNAAAMLGASGSLDDQTVTFLVQTSGPFAKVTLLDFNQLGPMVFQGIIVGQGKEQPKPEELQSGELELAPLTVKSNPDGSIGVDENGDGTSDMTVRQAEDGSYSYDMNGDGTEDLVLYPLTLS